MGGNESGGGGKPPTAAVSQVAPIARQYRNLATELWSEVAMRATSSMAAWSVRWNPTVAPIFGRSLERLQRKP
jgi:hypothetical protein